MGFTAALFDMDGTLLDSMDVWAQVDDDFLSARGIATPPDYGAALAGLDFRQSAEYTRARFQLSESIDEIIAGWNSLCMVQYEQRVPLKPGAAAYLRFLKRHGVKIAAATALEPHLFMPALKRLGIAHLFDAFATVGETGVRKDTGATYLLAAQRLGVAPEDCIVFEDILEGHIGARAAGMRSCNVYDRHADKKRSEINAIADFFTRDFRTGVPCPEGGTLWDRAVIIPAWCDLALNAELIQPGDCVIAADRGCVLCRESGIEPDFCVGDFDSLLPGEAIPAGAIVHPREKDDTDTLLALKTALEAGLTDIVLMGGIGGRLDHSLANLQLMRWADARGASLTIRTSQGTARLLRPGVHRLPVNDGCGDALFSLLAFSPEVTGVTITGARYCVENAVLTDDYPLGISNVAPGGAEVSVSFAEGRLLLIF